MAKTAAEMSEMDKTEEETKHTDGETTSIINLSGLETAENRQPTDISVVVNDDVSKSAKIKRKLTQDSDDDSSKDRHKKRKRKVMIIVSISIFVPIPSIILT